ncbi:hypothetical protein AVEN_118313-1 [Araneus ventricosus]|uniref:Uncharacterized protein n=1 Tax=Araneus ventricosus TaxID=182803 RepID=A0A4Y2T4R0_ARAVE|nr:hypothetical protein AVEN_118313-1 [Araneus ventricosus]
MNFLRRCHLCNEVTQEKEQKQAQAKKSIGFEQASKAEDGIDDRCCHLLVDEGVVCVLRPLVTYGSYFEPRPLGRVTIFNY